MIPERYPALVYRGIQVGFLLFVVDIFLLIASPTRLVAILLVLTASVTISIGVIVFLNVRESIDALREELKRRGRTGLVVDWPHYFWRGMGFALALVGVPSFIDGVANLF